VGGKSELHRVGCWVTPRRGDPTESATETYRQRLAIKTIADKKQEIEISASAGKGEMVR